MKIRNKKRCWSNFKTFIKWVSDSTNEINFQHQELLLADAQVSRLCKAFANNLSVNIKLSKTQLYKIGKSGGFLSRLLGPLLKTCLPLIRNVLKPLTKIVLLLGLTEAASATAAAIQNKFFVSGMATLIVSNDDWDDLMKIIKSLEESGLLIKDVTETI